MIFWEPGIIERATGGKWLQGGIEDLTVEGGICIDTRILKKGQVFVALHGEGADGHDYLVTAVKQGAGMLLVSDKECLKNEGVQDGVGEVPVLWVEDVTIAIQELARCYREHLFEHQVKVIAVTGSCGKTSTRHLIYTALSSSLDGTESYKSYNNHWGVPITLLGAAISDDFVVVEVGSNALGEIDHLGELIKPDAAVVTSIGTAHLGQFGSVGKIAEEKLSLFNHVLDGGVVVLPEDDLLPNEEMEVTIELMEGTEMVRYGHDEESDVYLLDVKPCVEGFELKLNIGVEFNLPTAGYHNTVNVLAAFCVSRWMGLDDQVVAGALSQGDEVPMRQEIMRYGDEAFPVVVINDAYNSSFESVEAGLMTLTTYAGKTASRRRIVVLGDMLEMGEFGAEMHEAVGEMILGWDKGNGGSSDGECDIQQSFDHVVLIGELSKHTAAVLAGSWDRKMYTVFEEWDDSVPEKVADLLKLGDLVLLKGSRGMALERVLVGIERKFGK